MKPKYKKGDILLDWKEFKEYKIVAVTQHSNKPASYIVERTDTKIFDENELDEFELLKEDKDEPKKTSKQSKKRK